MSETATGRIRRSVRFAQLEQQSGALRGEATPRRQRITVADHLEPSPFANTQDWTGGMGISPSGRFRVATDPGSREKPLNRKGIRKDWAGRVLTLMIAIMAVALLVELASLGAGQIRIQKLNARITAMEERNEELRESLRRSSEDISVCTEAVKLNLVSSNGVKPITLTAPSRARMVLMEAEDTLETGEIRASTAGTQGD